jgi:hypothetical protein
MAGEVRGKVYEAITKVALDQVANAVFAGASIYWHETPDWVDIDPDFTIGKSSNDIAAVVLVTHSGSEKLSEKKFWRNVGEVFQWKVQGPKPVRCYAILFESAVKPRLLIAEQTILDGTLDLALKPYGAPLKAYVRKNEGDFGDSDDARASHVEGLLQPKSKNYDKGFAAHFQSLCADLKLMLRTQSAGLENAWIIMRSSNSRPGRVPQAKNTYVRNGLAKLMVFDEEARKHLYTALRKGGTYNDVPAPSYATALGWVEEGIEGDTLVDNEIRSVVTTLGSKECEALIAQAPERMNDLIRPVRAIGNVKHFHQFVVDNFDDLITPGGMRKWMDACYVDPAELVKEGCDAAAAPSQHWLFVFCITLEKAVQGKVVAYGLSTLASDSGVPDSVLRFVMPLYVARDKEPESNTLNAVSKVFAAKLKSIGLAKLTSLEFRRSMQEMLRQRDLYVLSTYRNYDPLLWLIQLELKKAKIPFSEVTVPSLMGQLSGQNSASSFFLRVAKDTVIYWQTATTAGKGHKVKELGARFRSVMISSGGKAVVARPEVQKIYLVIDGEWDAEDLQILSRCGVSGIYYPDELPEMIAALSSVPKKLISVSQVSLPMAAEAQNEVPKLKRKGGHG